MTTVLSVHNSDGCVGRCDATCHNAQSADCTCICGGKNHGVGEEQAIANTAEMAIIPKEVVQMFEKTRQRTPGSLTIKNLTR